MQKEKDIIIKSTVDTFQTKDYIENREKLIDCMYFILSSSSEKYIKTLP